MELTSPLATKSYSFAVRVVKLSRILKQRETDSAIVKQILRSGTAIGALISEGVFAQSRADFINKYSIALKEANETKYWLNLLKDTEIITEKEYSSIFPECMDLVKMLVATINTTKRNETARI